MAHVEIIKANLNKDEKIVNVKLKNVCAYARVSTDSEEQLTSYESQIKHYENFIKSNSSWKFVGIYADEGISGTQVKHRTEFIRMMNDALNGKIDMIIAKSISRFARNTLDTLKCCRELREHNVDVYFEKENLHTMDLDSEMFLTFYSAFAQGESESISQNVKLGLKAKMKRGEYIGTANCYGYNWNKQTKKLEINEEQAEVVRLIFDLYLSGKGSKLIAQELDNRGIKTYTGLDHWLATTVRLILNNPKYVGDVCGQQTYGDGPLSHKRFRNYGEKEKYYAKDVHEPIISRETWEKTQKLYQSRSKKLISDGKSHNGKYSNKYSFSGKIKCGICGANYVRRMNCKKKNGTSNVYWSCSHRLDKVEKCSHSSYLKEEILEEMFIQIYNHIIEKKHKTKEKLINAIMDILTDDDNKANLDKLVKEKEKLNKRLSNLIDMKLDDYENKDAYILKEKEINNELKVINEKIDEYQMLEEKNKNISNQLKKIEEVLSAPRKLTKFERELFDSFVEQIVVGEKDENGNINSNVIRFILKIGSCYKCKINDNKSVSFGIDELVYLQRR